MKRIVVTGGIGAGKSVVSRMLRLKGFAVYDCDSEARRIMHESAEVRASLREWTGEELFDELKGLNRRRLAELIFNDNELRDKVNGLVHRLVREDLMAKSSLRSDHRQVLFIETAIPVVSGLAEMADAIWLVDAPEEVRIERACKRDEADTKAISRRIEAQKGEWGALPKEKTFRIDNDGRQALLPQVDHLITLIIN